MGNSLFSLFSDSLKTSLKSLLLLLLFAFTVLIVCNYGLSLPFETLLD